MSVGTATGEYASAKLHMGCKREKEVETISTYPSGKRGVFLRQVRLGTLSLIIIFIFYIDINKKPAEKFIDSFDFSENRDRRIHVGQVEPGF